MSRLVLGLGLTVVTASACVWYLPALADLRAGDDRPVFRRTAATACLTGWATAAAVALLVLVGTVWPVPGAVAVAGAAVTVVLRVRAGVQQRRERREIARRWVALGAPLAAPDHALRRRGGRARSAPRVARPQVVFAALVAVGTVAALALATLLVAAGPDSGRDWLVAAVAPAAVVGVFLTLAITCTRQARGTVPTRRP
ncbi:hypothetical protein [Streptomyces sp. TRM68416]|uniref:hypothetical protein n=1 Tax=Streptomyces sp. TRM68416 TaxID=2758412 RepID=UPI001661D5A3|nr:hypothetical protein [Streptomyces sp. TRM68416]MBD0839708.1 hypothetical protein [Streptomyces sp. TRM68416]